ncbi:hypothetical protein GGI35DRAFT_326345 [Trichoderma velutinum]
MRWHDCHQHDLHWMRPQAVLPLPHVLIAFKRFVSTRCSSSRTPRLTPSPAPHHYIAPYEILVRLALSNDSFIVHDQNDSASFFLEQSSCAIPFVIYFISTNASFGLFSSSILLLSHLFYFSLGYWNSWATEWLFAGTLYHYHGRQIDIFFSLSPPPCTRLAGGNSHHQRHLLCFSPLKSKNEQTFDVRKMPELLICQIYLIDLLGQIE